jgi:aminoglycoside phosphotransferase (APT) family kinase protein
MHEKSPRRYTDRLGLLSESQLQTALDCFGLGELLKAEPAPGGNFGQNVFLTSAKGDWVLRGCPHYTWQFPKEMFFARLIRERSAVRTPWPYMIEESCEIFGWSFAVMPRLPGVQLDDESCSGLAESDRVAIAGALGRELVLMHEVRWPYCADNGMNDDHRDTNVLLPLRSSYRDWIAGKVERRIAMCRAASDAMTDADADWCRGVLAAGEHALGAAFEPTLVHHDYKEGNVVAERDGENWRVGGVFDLMECYFGHPEEDLVRAVWDYVNTGLRSCAREFLRSYLAMRPPESGFRERWHIHMLRDCLLIWHFGRRRDWPFPPRQTFRQWAEPFVSFDPLE